MSLGSIKQIKINGYCAQSNPCQHSVTITMNDGREWDTCLNGSHIKTLIEQIGKARVHKDEIWVGRGFDAETNISTHFSVYETAVIEPLIKKVFSGS